MKYHSFPQKPQFARTRSFLAPFLLLLALTALPFAGQEALADDVLPLVAEDNVIDFTSEWSQVERPLVTEASAEVTVTTSDAVVASSERFRITVEVENGPLITLVDAGPGDPWESVTPSLRSGLGALAQSSLDPIRARFIVDATSGSDATQIEITGLQFEETGLPPQQAFRDTSLVAFEFFAGMIDPTSGESIFTREFGDLGSQEFVTLQIRYHGLTGNPIDQTTLGDDDICVEGAELFGFDPEIEFVSSSQEDKNTRATYRLHRPEEGWEAFERRGTLDLSVCLGGVRSESGNRQTAQVGELSFGPPAWQDVLPRIWDPELPLRERKTGPYFVDSLDQPFKDISFQVNASRIPTGALSSGDLVQAIGFEAYPAELLETGVIENGFYEVTYRFDRPPGGWPFFGSTIAFSHEFRPRRDLLQPGAVLTRQLQTITGIQFQETMRPPVIPLMKHGTADALSSDTFELTVDFFSQNGINVDSIGDGDLRLLHERRPVPSGQDGRLLRTEVKEEGRRVTAVYEFQRDPNAVFSGTWIKPYSPRGAVMDLAGNATPGGLAEEFSFNGMEFIFNFNVIRQEESIPQGEFDYGFIPLSPYHPNLAAYHFRVVYSSPVPIDLDDFVAHPHLMGETQPLGNDAQERLPDLHPELQNWRSTDEGRLVEADYLIERPESGWPRSVVLTLIQQGIRDIEKRVPPVPENSPTLGTAIADLGGDIDEAIRVTVLGGHEVLADAETHQIAVLLEANERLQASEFTDSLVWFGWHPELLPGLENFDLPFPSAGRLVNFFNVADENIDDYELRVFFNSPAGDLPETGSGHYDIWVSGDTIRFRAFAQNGRVLIDSTQENGNFEQILFSESNLSGKARVRDVSGGTRQTLINIARIDGELKGGLAVATYEVQRPVDGWEAWDLGQVPFVLQVPAAQHRVTRIAGSAPFVGTVDVLEATTPLPLLQGFEDWLKELEEKSGLPIEKAAGDPDHDGQSSLIEYALGSDATNGADIATLDAGTVSDGTERFISLTVPVRVTAVGVTIEIQSSVDGKEWQSVSDHFETVERRPGSAPEVEHLVLKAKAPLNPEEKVRLYRAVVVR